MGQVYAQRLFTLAQEAFAGQQGGLGAVKSQMIGFFVDALCHDFLKMKVMCDNPKTFQGAVATAMNEQNLCKRFNLDATSSPTIQEEEPMEIGHGGTIDQRIKITSNPDCVLNVTAQTIPKRDCPQLKAKDHNLEK